MEHTRNVPNKSVESHKARKHFPKASTSILEVVMNTQKITGGGEAYTARIIKTFLDEVTKGVTKYGRLTIPDTFEIYVSVQAEKQNNIKKAERFGSVTEIVPEHFIIKVKPHVQMRKVIRNKSTKSQFMPKPTKAELG
jgi:hypothetical protein